MRVTVMSVFLWALLLAARIDARPQELGTTKATRMDMTKQQIAIDAWNNSTTTIITTTTTTTTTPSTSTKPKNVGSRYRATSSASRNIHEFYSRFHGFTPGIINSIKPSSSRGFRLPQNWPNLNPTNNSRTEQFNVKLMRNESPSRYGVKVKSVNNIRIHEKDKKHKNNSKISKNPVQKATTKFPSRTKNRLTVKSKPKPSRIFFISQAMPAVINNTKKINRTTTTTRFTTSNPLSSTTLLKNWPNDPIRNTQDIINYQKYTTLNDKVELQTSSSLKLKPEEPVPSNYYETNSVTTLSPFPNSTTNYKPPMETDVEEIIQWLHIPPFSTSQNQSIITQDIKSGETYTNTFEPLFNPNKPLSSSNPIVDYDESANDFHFSSQLPATSSESYYQHMDAVTVVPNYSIETATFLHAVSTLVNDAISTDSVTPQRRPVFRPSSEISQNTVIHIINPSSKKPNVTVSEGQILDKNISNAQPNVHIMFATEDDAESQENLKDTFGDSDCPTITINSITHVNNTIASKEGCTDLNIIINSQLLSTNNFNPGGLGSVESVQDKYVDNAGTFSTVYSPTLSDISSSSSSIDYPSASTLSDPDRNDSNDPDNEESEDDLSYDVDQQTDIELNDELPVEATFSDDSGNSESEESASQAGEVADEIPNSVTQGSTIAGSSDAVGQSNDALVSDTAGEVADAPEVTNTGDVTSGVAGGGSSTSLSPVNNDNDDDEDYDYGDETDLSPGNIMNGMTNLFTYFTFLNPFNYGVFSLAAAPFAALTAGILGVAAVFFPWAFTSGLDFARTNKDSLCFRDNLENVIKQSIHHYRTFPEWKSKRKKRRR